MTVNSLTSYTSYVIVELFLKPGGLLVLPVEVLQVLLEYVVQGPIYLTKVLKELWTKKEKF